MLKKKHNLHKQIILKQNYVQIHLEKLVIKSLSQNQFLKPIQRLSFFMQYSEKLNRFNFFSSYQKLSCLTTLSNKVSNKKYLCSRFFLNKQLNSLVYSNTLK